MCSVGVAFCPYSNAQCSSVEAPERPNGARSRSFAAPPAAGAPFAPVGRELAARATSCSASMRSGGGGRACRSRRRNGARSCRGFHKQACAQGASAAQPTRPARLGAHACAALACAGAPTRTRAAQPTRAPELGLREGVGVRGTLARPWSLACAMRPFRVQGTRPRTRTRPRSKNVSRQRDAAQSLQQLPPLSGSGLVGDKPSGQACCGGTSSSLKLSCPVPASPGMASQ